MNSISVRALLVRGMLAGLIAGALALVVAYCLGESRVDAAIALEEAHSHDHGGGEELVSRTMQSTAGLATGVLVFGVAIGGIAALVFCYALGRMGRFGPRATAALIAGAALLTVYVVPFLKYPANPCGRRQPRHHRQTHHAVLPDGRPQRAAGRRRRHPREATGSPPGRLERDDRRGSRLCAGDRPRVRLPALVQRGGKDFPATLLWQFRLATLAVQFTLWTTFGLVFGYLTERLLVPRAQAATAGSGTSERTATAAG